MPRLKSSCSQASPSSSSCSVPGRPQRCQLISDPPDHAGDAGAPAGSLRWLAGQMRMPHVTYMPQALLCSAGIMSQDDEELFYVLEQNTAPAEAATQSER